VTHRWTASFAYNLWRMLRLDRFYEARARLEDEMINAKLAKDGASLTVEQ
jgi:hypothetical protein